MTETETKTEQPINLDSFFARTFAETEISLREKLNSMIGAGASFDVSLDDFQVFGAGNLTESEKQFLTVNKSAILCTLQQVLLVKDLFSQKPELRQTFIAIIEGKGASFEAACEITSKWFARLLDTIPDRKTNN